MKKMLQRGFTLIELLVVIAIIGILAAVVLASLNDARSSGSDAAIKQSLGNARSQAEIFYNQNNFSYALVCSNAQVIQLVEGARNAAGITTAYTGTGAVLSAATSATTATCHHTATGWAISVPLASDNTQSWCVDSTGQAGAGATTGMLTASATDVSCNN